MCMLCDSDQAKAYFEFLYQRQRNRRALDAERFKDTNSADFKKRPCPGERNKALLCYAVGTNGRYVGYSGAAGGMVAPKSGVLDEAQSERRLNRLKAGGLSERNRADQEGLLAGWRNRPYCNCAEACAASIALAHGEPIGDLIFVAFSNNYRPAPPCPNCTSWLNRLSAGYFTIKDSHTDAVGEKDEEFAAEILQNKGNVAPTARLERSNSFNLIINPGRDFRDTPFQTQISDNKGKPHSGNFIFRCFRMS